MALIIGHSFRLDIRSPYDRPPFFDFVLVESAERLRRLQPSEYFLPDVRQPPPYGHRFRSALTTCITGALGRVGQRRSAATHQDPAAQGIRPWAQSKTTGPHSREVEVALGSLNQSSCCRTGCPLRYFRLSI